ncbi:MAG: hypothetical protein ACYDDF_12375 [Thermoplasmatota archaeon]
MRGACVALVSMGILAGCIMVPLHAAQSAPYAPERLLARIANETILPGVLAERTGPWTAVFTPGNVSGPYGAVVPVRVDLHRDGAVPVNALISWGGWERFGATPYYHNSPRLTSATTTLTGWVVVGPIANAGLIIEEANGSGGAAFTGPRVFMSNKTSAGISTIPTVGYRSGPPLPVGPSLVVDATRATLSLARRLGRFGDCDEETTPIGNATLEVNGTSENVTFVVRFESSDVCSGGTGLVERYPAAQAEFNVPAAVDHVAAVIQEGRPCMCPVGGFATYWENWTRAPTS